MSSWLRSTATITVINKAKSNSYKTCGPKGYGANDQSMALRSALQYGVYLQQDVLTGFLTAETGEQRFNVFSQFVGAGAATELQLALEGSRRAWSRATNVLANRLQEKEQRTEQLESQLRELEGDDLPYNVNAGGMGNLVDPRQSVRCDPFRYANP